MTKFSLSSLVSACQREPPAGSVLTVSWPKAGAILVSENPNRRFWKKLTHFVSLCRLLRRRLALSETWGSVRAGVMKADENV